MLIDLVNLLKLFRTPYTIEHTGKSQSKMTRCPLVAHVLYSCFPRLQSTSQEIDYVLISIMEIERY